jgi:hypothetical protein
VSDFVKYLVMGIIMIGLAGALLFVTAIVLAVIYVLGYALLAVFTV